MNNATPYEVAMIAATLGRTDAQGVEDAYQLLLRAAERLAITEPDNRIRTVPEALKEIGFKNIDGLKALLAWKYRSTKEAENSIEHIKKNGVSAIFIDEMLRCKNARRRAANRDNRLGKVWAEGQIKKKNQK